jgi:hypothetical protein
MSQIDFGTFKALLTIQGISRPSYLWGIFLMQMQSPSNQRNLYKKPWIDYKCLHDPDIRFPDEDEIKEIILTTAEIIYAAMSDTPLRGDPKTIQEVKLSPEWPEWKKTIKYKLKQLTKMGTC